MDRSIVGAAIYSRGIHRHRERHLWHHDVLWTGMDFYPASGRFWWIVFTCQMSLTTGISMAWGSPGSSISCLACSLDLAVATSAITKMLLLAIQMLTWDCALCLMGVPGCPAAYFVHQGAGLAVTAADRVVSLLEAHTGEIGRWRRLAGARLGRWELVVNHLPAATSSSPCSSRVSVTQSCLGSVVAGQPPESV